MRRRTNKPEVTIYRSSLKFNTVHDYLEVDAWVKIQHRLDVFAEVVHPITPHDEGDLHDGDDQNRDTGPIGVHDVQHILPSLHKEVKFESSEVPRRLHLGDAGQA